MWSHRGWCGEGGGAGQVRTAEWTGCGLGGIVCGHHFRPMQRAGWEGGKEGWAGCFHVENGPTGFGRVGAATGWGLRKVHDGIKDVGAG